MVVAKLTFMSPVWQYSKVEKPQISNDADLEFRKREVERLLRAGSDPTMVGQVFRAKDAGFSAEESFQEFGKSNFGNWVAEYNECFPDRIATLATGQFPDTKAGIEAAIQDLRRWTKPQINTITGSRMNIPPRLSSMMNDSLQQLEAALAAYRPTVRGAYRPKSKPKAPISISALNELIAELAESPDERIICALLKRFPRNDDEVLVGMKIILIDSIYSTNLRMHKSEISPFTIAMRLAKMPDLDERIQSGDLSVADDILEMMPERNLFSFVSKYLTLHSYYCYSNDSFVIYDDIVASELPKYSGLTKSYINNLRINQDYKEYVRIIDQVITDNDLLTDFPRRKVDWYLWAEGKKARAKERR